MRKELLENIIDLKKLGIRLGVFIKSVEISRCYCENDSELIPKRVLGLDIENGTTNDIIINGEDITKK